MRGVRGSRLKPFDSEFRRRRTKHFHHAKKPRRTSDERFLEDFSGKKDTP
jgi:hypothetical protein